MTFLTRYELRLELEHVSVVKTKSQKICGYRKEKSSRGSIPPAEIGLKCLQKKNIHCKKEGCGFQSIDKCHCKEKNVSVWCWGIILT